MTRGSLAPPVVMVPPPAPPPAAPAAGGDDPGYWLLLLIFVLPSVLLMAGMLAGLPRSESRSVRLVGRVAIVCAATVPSMIVLLGILFCYDMSLPRDAQRWTNRAASGAVGAMIVVELLLVIGGTGIALGSAKRRGWVLRSLAALSAVCLLPLTLLALVVAGQMLAGVSL